MNAMARSTAQRPAGGTPPLRQAGRAPNLMAVPPAEQEPIVMNLRKPLFAAAALAAAYVNTSAALSPALARGAEGVTISYADLNLANPAGRAVLDRRIAAAARQVCGQYLIGELKWAEMSRECRVEVTASAAIPGATRLASLRVSRAAF